MVRGWLWGSASGLWERLSGWQQDQVEAAAKVEVKRPAAAPRLLAGRLTELSGVDLARQALVAARETAKKNGTTRKEKPKRRTGTVVRRDGREPLGLGAAIRSHH
ncbi:hypothetical protein [Streptomyces europaeiscabiei]|uniref:hypothetical protein n=1 Tax=Streptomyces europaeiscabiei TaxID=146819 RepID=UPI002E1333F1|nr:hypothetical protein OHB30_51120 [Streptomyces europaeiscabiei]